MKNLFESVLLLLCALLTHAQAQAAIVTFDNMPTNTYSTQVGRALYGPNRSGVGSPSTIQGMQFTASTSGYLSSILAPMTTATFWGQVANVQLSLWSDAGNSPLSLISSSSLQVGPVSPSPILSWNWGGTSFLQQGQKYWITAQTNTSNAIVSWQYVPTYLSTTALTASTNSGQSNWTVFNGNGGEMAMRVMVTPVPEPEIFAMLLSGLGLLGWMGKRRQRAFQ